MAKTSVTILDLNFQGKSQAIASYLIKGKDAVVLIESGPGSTLTGLDAGLASQGLSSRDITHILLTHIHLDHAGAAGFLSRQGAEIFVHPNGAAHLVNPEKLLASATRIYGEQMQSLWGDFLPVQEGQLRIPMDGDEISIANLRFTAVDTPGHAGHHYCYLFEDICFSGDVGGIRIPGYSYIRAPMPPPELHLEKWRASISRLRTLKFDRIAPTHFGIYNNPRWQLDELDRILVSTDKWLDTIMPANPPIEEFRKSFISRMEEQGREQRLSDEAIRAFGLANPLGMSADGLMRYWIKAKRGDN